MAGLVRARLAEPGTDEEKSRRFADDLQRELRRQMTDAQVAAYLAAAPPELLWLGLARYWRKRNGGLKASGSELGSLGGGRRRRFRSPRVA